MGGRNDFTPGLQGIKLFWTGRNRRSYCFLFNNQASGCWQLRFGNGVMMIQAAKGRRKCRHPLKSDRSADVHTKYTHVHNNRPSCLNSCGGDMYGAENSGRHRERTIYVMRRRAGWMGWGDRRRANATSDPIIIIPVENPRSDT